MALTPQTQPRPSVEDSFIADRAMFWNRFTGFTKGAVIALAILLVLMWLFLA